MGKWGPHVIWYKPTKTKIDLEKKNPWVSETLNCITDRLDVVWKMYYQSTKPSKGENRQAISLPVFLISTVKRNFTEKYKKTNTIRGMSRHSVDLLKRYYYPMPEKSPTSPRLQGFYLCLDETKPVTFLWVDGNGDKHLRILFRESVTRDKRVKLAPETFVEIIWFSSLGIMSHQHNCTTPILELAFL